jgi:Domain of unknown function (DUF4360)
MLSEVSMNRYLATVVPTMTRAAGGCAAALLASALLLAQPGSSAAAQLPSAPEGFGARVAAVNGSGCPHGTVTVHELPYQAGFMATYTVFRAEVMPGDMLNFRKNCQFSVRLQAPPGYAYSAVSALYHGYAKLARGTRGTQETSYYFQGQPQTFSTSHPLPGPLSGAWSHAEHVTLAALGSSACGQTRILNINAQLIVYPAGGAASGPTDYLALNSANHGYTTYRFIRARCP